MIILLLIAISLVGVGGYSYYFQEPPSAEPIISHISMWTGTFLLGLIAAAAVRRLKRNREE